MVEILDWLLEQDGAQPGVRYFSLVDLLGRPAADPEVIAARQAVMERGPVPAILAAQDPAGFWCEPGAGYNPKYRSSVWSIIYLAQLGADPADRRVQAGGEYMLRHAIATTGAFSAGSAPSGTIWCLAGNLGRALADLGFSGDERWLRAIEILARHVTGEGVAPRDDRQAPLRYYGSGLCAPGFRCSANDKQPCGWGAVKVLQALARVPAAGRTPLIDAAQAAAIDFLLSVDPATAAYPSGYSAKPSSSWFKFGFPVFYITDVLQVAESLAEVDLGADARLAALRALIAAKRDAAGRWKMEYSYAGKIWGEVEDKGQPSKWVTLRALRALGARQGLP